MKKISLSSILLFALVIPYVMTYRIGPGETPYWLFGIIFLILLLYLILDLLKINGKVYFKFKDILLWMTIVIVVGSSAASNIIVRHQTSPVYGVHDIILQQEAAIRFLIHGKNPYAVTYFGTPLEQFNYSDKEVNPALYHFVMQPFYLLFALPFYFISNHTIGYFDGRIPLLFLFFSILLISSYLVKDRQKKQLFLILLTFNPATLHYLIEGRSDVFMYAFFFLGLYLLHFKKYLLAAVPMALAFAVKQSVWPFAPFYVVFLYFKTRSVRQVIKSLVPFIIVFSVITLPFFLWNQKAFIDSTVNYLSGKTAHSYPISGYGFGRVLNELGVIKDLKAYYPFQIWQIIIGLPVLIILLKFLKESPKINRLILVYTIFLFVYWYFSRYFHNSHLGFLSMLFITSYFWPEEN